MSKKFLTLKEAEQYICKGRLYVDERIMLASSLQDYIRENNIEIVYGDIPQVNSECESENIINKNEENNIDISLVIRKILKDDFDVQDENKIKQVIKIMKEVLKEWE